MQLIDSVPMQAAFDAQPVFDAGLGSPYVGVELHSLFRGAQVDGVCPHCGRWHTVAWCNGSPSCHVVSEPRSGFRKTGGTQ